MLTFVIILVDFYTFAKIAITSGMVILLILRIRCYVWYVDYIFLFDILNVLFDMFLERDNDFFLFILS